MDEFEKLTQDVLSDHHVGGGDNKEVEVEENNEDGFENGFDIFGHFGSKLVERDSSRTVYLTPEATALLKKLICVASKSGSEQGAKTPQHMINYASGLLILRDYLRTWQRYEAGDSGERKEEEETAKYIIYSTEYFQCLGVRVFQGMCFQEFSCE